MEEDDWFEVEVIEDNVFKITEKHYHPRQRANIWLLYDKEKSILIDSGLGIKSIRKFIESRFAVNQIIVIASHCHFDHSGGLHEFENVYCHEAEYEALKKGDELQLLSAPCYNAISERDFDIRRVFLSSYKVNPVPQIKSLKENDIIKNENWRLTVIHMPGHSKGSILLYDKNKGIGFCGDIIYDGELYNSLPGSNIEEYRKTLIKLLEISFIKLCPGHFQELDYNFIKEKIKLYLGN